jgi:adenylosuccinate lyase
MIERYKHKEMSRHWEEDARWSALLTIEKAVAVAQAKYKIIPQAAATAIQRKAKFDVKGIKKIEAKTKHDIIAFVSNVASYVGDYGRYVHYGLTSSDVLDSATSLQILAAGKDLEKALDVLEKSFRRIIKLHKKTLCSGRTHGMHAEPTTFGYKMAGFYVEFLRNRRRIAQGLNEAARIKLSGAVGTYSFQSEQVEKAVAKTLGLQVEDVATQVIPRDRHAELLGAFALYAAGLDRLSIELRHLQRTEVGEVVEGFTLGQKGSSAMPHKKNPISAENISGLCRVIKSNANIALENVSLWHERDISHSSTERIILPDSFELIHYVTLRMAKLLDGLYVDKQRMLDNMKLSGGALFSSHVLLALIEKGKWTREDAYKKVQALSHGLQKGESLEDALKKDNEVSNILTNAEIRKIFSGVRHTQSIEKRLTKILN